MDVDEHKKSKDRSVVGSAVAVTPSIATAPSIMPRAVTDPHIIDEGRVFHEAIRQTKPLAAAGTREAAQAAQAVGAVHFETGFVQKRVSDRLRARRNSEASFPGPIQRARLRKWSLSQTIATSTPAEIQVLPMPHAKSPRMFTIFGCRPTKRAGRTWFFSFARKTGC